MKTFVTYLYSCILAAALLFGSAAVYAADKDPAVAWDKINKGAMIIDVRTAEEFAKGHLAGAINIPYEKISTEFANRGITKDTSVVLYCRSGRRSGIAHEELAAAGYQATYNGGGLQTLQDNRPAGAASTPQ